MFKVMVCMIIGVFGLVSTGYARFDPTRPADYRDVGAKKFVRKVDIAVTAIIIADDRRIAVVNDYVVKVGDEILGVKITGIDKDKVSFRGHEGDFSVPLHIPVGITK
jgi:hypothetical protein